MTSACLHTAIIRPESQIAFCLLCRIYSHYNSVMRNDYILCLCFYSVGYQHAVLSGCGPHAAVSAALPAGCHSEEAHWPDLGKHTACAGPTHMAAVPQNGWTRFLRLVCCLTNLYMEIFYIFIYIVVAGPVFNGTINHIC